MIDYAQGCTLTRDGGDKYRLRGTGLCCVGVTMPPDSAPCDVHGFWEWQCNGCNRAGARGQ